MSLNSNTATKSLFNEKLIVLNCTQNLKSSDNSPIQLYIPFYHKSFTISQNMMTMNRVTQLLILVLFLNPLIYSQQVFYLPTYWEVEVKGGIYNIETADVNRDGHLDIISGNFNDTYVYFGGKDLLDSTGYYFR